jgi:hypothetical protein
MKHRAILCDSGLGANFYGIRVSNNCNTNTSSDTYLGSSYINDIKIESHVVFMGWSSFKVKEIAIFEIAA